MGKDVERNRRNAILANHRGFCGLFNYTHQHMHIYIYNLSLKFTLKHLKRSYMFRTHDHPQGCYMLPEDDRVIETCQSVLNVLM